MAKSKSVNTIEELCEIAAEAAVMAATGRLSAVDGKNLIGLINSITAAKNYALKEKLRADSLGLQAQVIKGIKIGCN